MNIQVDRLEKVTVVEIANRVDASSAVVFAEVLDREIAHGHIELVIDMSDVDYIGSAGLRLLLAAFHRVKTLGGDLRLAQPSYNVEEVLNLCGLSAVFKTYPTQLAAVRSY